MSLKVGALFAGYGGIELALGSVLDTELAWYADCCKYGKDGTAGHTDPHGAPCAILAHHHPDQPNLGDVTKIDWAAVEPVDIITGGSPCQDLSHAGKRAGMKAGTRSGLWASMCDAIDIIRPRLVVWENVRGALSAEADSAVEPCPICVGDGERVTLRALGRVLGDLAELGYDARWYGLHAADVGAAHGRFRVFLFATPADTPGAGDGGVAGLLRGQAAADGRQGAEEGRLWDASQRAGSAALTLLPTPAVNDMGAAYTPETWDAWTARMKAEHGNGNGHGKSLNIEALRLLPTPNTLNFKESGLCRDFGGDMTHALLCGCQGERSVGTSDELRGAREVGSEQNWGDYEVAIRRWEASLGRTAPAPTIARESDNKPQLSAIFCEWLMGLPEGHVTDPAIGISRNDQLKALGNGVVPQQCAAALRAFLTDTALEVAA